MPKDKYGKPIAKPTITIGNEKNYPGVPGYPKLNTTPKGPAKEWNGPIAPKKDPM
jgi:hypothetical protein